MEEDLTLCKRQGRVLIPHTLIKGTVRGLRPGEVILISTIPPLRLSFLIVLCAAMNAATLVLEALLPVHMNEVRSNKEGRSISTSFMSPSPSALTLRSVSVVAERKTKSVQMQSTRKLSVTASEIAKFFSR